MQISIEIHLLLFYKLYILIILVEITKTFYISVKRVLIVFKCITLFMYLEIPIGQGNDMNYLFKQSSNNIPIDIVLFEIFQDIKLY